MSETVTSVQRLPNCSFPGTAANPRPSVLLQVVV